MPTGVESNEPLAGLSAAEAARRLGVHGPNVVPGREGDPFWRRLARQFANPLIYLLLAALAFDLGGWIWEGRPGLPFESLAIGTILVLNAGLGLYQEGQARQALARLAAMAAPLAWVRRDGSLRQVPARELVPGDLVRLEAGDRIPADGRLLPPAAVMVDESLLTGESVPLERGAGEELSGGTLLVRGLAWCELLRTGPLSAMGRLAGLLQEVIAEPTPLERRLDAFGRQVLRWVLLLALLVTAGGLAVEGLGRLGEVLLFAVALAVAAVPEGLPAVLTLTLSLGVERMARRRAVVRRLPAVEALGAVTVIAVDKTGTLTENRMEVRALEADDPAAALDACVLANDAQLSGGVGDPLELALLQHASAAGVDVAGARAARPRQAEEPFDSVRRYMSVTVGGPQGPRRYLKGAPEVLLPRCDLAPEARERWLERAAGAAREGHKVLGLAWASGAGEGPLAWAGLALLWDPPRAGVTEAIARARAAGIRVVMLTGDHPETALAVARQVGLPAQRAITGAELGELDERALERLLAGEAAVFARVAPEHKLRLVELLQRAGHVVAMTGDGVNDAPALKRADVGVVMGQRGSDVAREAGDVILLDDDFSTIVAAVEEGRGIYANIQKFIRLLFATNLSELVVVVVGTAGAVLLALQGDGGRLLLPLTAAQILWINLVSDSLPALAVGMDRNLEMLAGPPRDPRTPLLDRRSVSFVVLTGLLLAAVPLGLLVVVPWLGQPREVARALAFHVLVASQLLATFPARSLDGPAPRNRAVWLAVGVVLLLQLGLAVFRPLHPFLGLAPIPPALLPWGLGGVGLTLLALEGLRRWLAPRRPAGAGVAPA